MLAWFEESDSSSRVTPSFVHASELIFQGLNPKLHFLSWTSPYLAKNSQLLIGFSLSKALFEFRKLISGSELNSNHIQLGRWRVPCSAQPGRWPSALGWERATARAACRPAGARRNRRKRTMVCGVRGSQRYCSGGGRRKDTELQETRTH